MPTRKPHTDSHLKNLGYDWIKVKVEDIGTDLTKILKKNNADCYTMDVYASNSEVYRNISCILEEELNFESEIRIRYNKNTGKDFVISKELLKK